MPRLYPPEPDFGDHQSAERDVWDRLRKALPDEVVLLHSVPVRHGSAEHEIDLLVAWPGVGLAAIEVKGGQVSLTGGQWYQSDRKGKHPIQNPMAQVQGAAHALKQWLDQHSGTDSVVVSPISFVSPTPIFPRTGQLRVSPGNWCWMPMT